MEDYKTELMEDLAVEDIDTIMEIIDTMDIDIDLNSYGSIYDAVDDIADELLRSAYMYKDLTYVCYDISDILYRKYSEDYDRTCSKLEANY